MNNTPSDPKWYPIRSGFRPDDPKCGEILCSFSIVNCDFKFKIDNPRHENLGNYIPIQEQNVEINCLGLRQLQSVGIMPVQKPFIRFNINSLLPPEKAQVVKRVCTEPKNTGNSPNINTKITFTVEMPVSSLYCPKLSCEVFDTACGGFKVPKLGTFTIDVGGIMQKKSYERAEYLRTADQLIIDLGGDSKNLNTDYNNFLCFHDYKK